MQINEFIKKLNEASISQTENDAFNKNVNNSSAKCWIKLNRGDHDLIVYDVNNSPQKVFHTNWGTGDNAPKVTKVFDSFVKSLDGKTKYDNYDYGYFMNIDPFNIIQKLTKMIKDPNSGVKFAR